MRTLVYFALGICSISSILTSCGNSNPFDKVVNAYTNGEITDDSILAYMSDSINYQNVYDWAVNNEGKNDYATYVIGRCYKLGLAVDQDVDKAKGYYIKAANAGIKNAMGGLAEIYSNFGIKYFNVDSAEYWYNKVAEKGDGSAYLYLSQIKAYRDEQSGVQSNPYDLIAIIDKGVKMKDPLCVAYAAGMYYFGQGVQQDKKKAGEIISSINKDKLDPIGQYVLGQMLQDGEMGVPNYNEAFKYIKKSADAGHLDAKCQLGAFYVMGQGVEKNDSIAFTTFKEAANFGSPWGMRCVANCYTNGIGVEVNMPVAEEWMRNAARAGDEDAKTYCNVRGLKYQ